MKSSSFEDLDIDMMPPPAKRIELDNDRMQKSGLPWNKHQDCKPVLPSSQPVPGGLAKSEFPLRNLEDFYKACPSYRLPVEIGSFSLDEKGQQHLSRNQLRYFTPPAASSRLNFDLKVGYDQYISNKCNIPSDKLNPILRWIAANGDYFRPKVSGPKSPEKDRSFSANIGSGMNADRVDVKRKTSVDGIPNPMGSNRNERPDDLLTNFVTWRGMVTKMLCSPYNKSEPWKVAATLYNKTTYLCEVETQEARDRMAKETPRMKEMSYWGLKFEDYITSVEPLGVNVNSSSTISSHKVTVNSERAFCTVVRTRMSTHSIVMAAEVDCCDHVLKVSPPQNYIELKTNRVILTDRNKSSFRTYKLLKWWAQSFLVGVPRIVCGFRDDDGIVKNLQHFKTATLAHDTQNDLSLWQPAVCLNFLDELLSWIRRAVVCDGPREVYMLSWEPPYTHVTCTKCLPDSEHIFLPDWFVHKRSSSEE